VSVAESLECNSTSRVLQSWIRSIIILFVLLITSSLASAQSRDSASSLFSLAAIGTARTDSTLPYPTPIVFLEIKDTSRYALRVRFPHLGILGLIEDTIYKPSLVTSRQGYAFAAIHPLLQLTFPKTDYALWVDVVDKKLKKLVGSSPIEAKLDISAYDTVSFFVEHAPTTGMGNPLLRRQFKPLLLPLTIEANPGWLCRESLNPQHVYSLSFIDPTDTTIPTYSLVFTPTESGIVDSAAWEHFKLHVETDFGNRGYGVRPLNDFVQNDSRARRLVGRGWEFITRSKETLYDYHAMFLLPHDALLISAPLGSIVDPSSLKYYEAIARSFQIAVQKAQAATNGSRNGKK
jgi:hypothetical protein